jgi:O-antigen/teichoic acid export membrane protein
MYYSLTRATVWNLAGYLYLLIAALLSTPILVQYLGHTVFAQYSLILATLILVSSLDFGLPQAVVRALARQHDNSAARRTLWATSSVLFLLTGLIGAFIATFVTYRLKVDPIILPIIFSLGLLNNLVAHYSTLPQAEGHFGYFNVKTFIVGTVNTLLAAYLAMRGYGIMQILLALLFSYLLSLFILAYFSLKFFPHPRQGRPSLQVAKSLINFGLKNQVGKIVSQAQSQYGKYLLISLSSLMLTSYVIAQGLVQKLVGGVAQLATAFYPAASRSGQYPQLRRIYYRLQLYLFLLGIAGVILYQFVGLPFLTWWLKDPSLVNIVHSFLSLYRYYGLLLLLTPMASTVLDSLGYPGITSLFGIIAFMLELIWALILYPTFGILALAYAGIISLGVMTPALLLFTGRILSRGGNSPQPTRA